MENNRPNLNNRNAEYIDYRELMQKYLKRWHWFLISIVVCLLTAYIYLKSTNNQYQVQTTILLRKDQNNTGNLVDMSMLEGLGISGTSKEVEDEIQVLSSKALTQSVIRSLNLETEYFKKNGLRYDEVYPIIPVRVIFNRSFNDTIKEEVEIKIRKITSGFKINYKYGSRRSNFEIQELNSSINTPEGTIRFQQFTILPKNFNYKIVSYPIKKLTERYCGNIKVASVNKKSSAISITTIASNFKKAELILNKLIELYNLDAVNDKKLIASNTAVFVQERLKLIGVELQDVELSVENYKKKNKLTDISSEAGIFLKSSSEYDQKLAELETQLNLVGYIEIYVKDNKHQYDLVPANLGIEDKSLLSLMQDYNKALLDRLKLRRTTNERNPVITQLEQQLKELRLSIITSIGSIKDGLKISKRDMTQKDAQFTSKIRDVPTQERQYVEIKRQQEIKEKLYLYLLQKREENALSLAGTIPSAKTVDSAYTSLTPVAPKETIIYLISFILGLVIPLLYFYTVELLNNRITNSKELKRLVKVPYLGAVGIKKENDVVVVHEGKTTPIVEMFRIIRTNMQFMLAGKEKPVILVTSSISGEGKSFISINIAMSMALMKKKVILVGLDIRSPMLGEYLHLSKERGVTMFISDESYSVNDIIIPSKLHAYLDVIPAGPVPPNPAELIMNQRLDDLFVKLREMYDCIIVDSAPIGLVSDTYLLNRLVDNCIYVARENYTPREACDLINEIYDHKKINNMAVVLNGVNESSSSYGYGYGHGKYKDEDYNKKIKLINRIRK